jgi:hypothetical protein
LKIFKDRAEKYLDTSFETFHANDNSTKVDKQQDKKTEEKDSTPPKTPEEGFSLLVPREISFEVWSNKKKKKNETNSNRTTQDGDIQTQLADEMPTQPAC